MTVEKKSRNILMWVLLVFLPPIGIIYMWVTKKDMSKKKRALLSIIFIFWFFICLAINGNKDTDNSKEKSQTKVETKKETSKEKNKEEITITELSASYSGSTEEGTVIDNSNSGITVSAKYTNGTEAKKLSGWDVENPSSLIAGQTTVYKIKFSDYECELSITCTTPSMTMGQKNALDKGKSYLDYSAFSYSGLIGQLEHEGFTTEDATFAADNCGADWNEQAAQKAQDYLDYSSFSRDGLIGQLEHEGFTAEQAEYGVSAVGY
jgi:hypothetical protein